MKSRSLATLLGASLIALAMATQAQATSKIRVEWVITNMEGSPRGAAEGSPLKQSGGQSLTVSGSTVSSTNVAPAFNGLSTGFARISPLTGAVVCTFDGSTPTDTSGSTNGIRIAAGDSPKYLSITTGSPISCIEALDQPSPTGGGGGGGGGGATTLVDGADTTQGFEGDLAASNNTGSWTVVSMLKGLFGLHTTTNTTLSTISTNQTTAQTSFNAMVSSLSSIATGTSAGATAVGQTTTNTSLATLHTDFTTNNSALASLVTNTTGIATSALQTTGNASLSTIATNSASQATAALQTTGNASLSAIATNTAAAHYPSDVAVIGATLNAATLNAAYTVSLASGEATTSFAVSGLTASGDTMTFEGSNDNGLTYTSINEIPLAGVEQATITTDGQYRLNTAARTKVRLRISTIGTPGTGTITISSNASTATGVVSVIAPAGSIADLNTLVLATSNNTASPPTYSIAGWLQQILSNGSAPIPTGGNTIGNVGLVAGSSAIGSITNTSFGISGSLPAGTALLGSIKLTDAGGTNQLTIKPASTAAADTDTSVVVVNSPRNFDVAGSATTAINVSAAVTTQLVAPVSGKVIDVTHYHYVVAGAESVYFEYGTGSLCGTGTTVLEGPIPLAANGGMVVGNGAGTVLNVPSGNALCIVNGSAVQLSGSVQTVQH